MSQNAPDHTKHGFGWAECLFASLLMARTEVGITNPSGPSLPPPPPAPPAQSSPQKPSPGRGVRAAQGAGWTITVIGAALLGLAALMYALIERNAGSEAGWGIIILIPFVGFGSMALLVGGSILLVKNIHQGRKGFQGDDPAAPGTDAVRSTLPFAFVFPFFGLVLSLYVYFAGKPGTTGRNVGLVALAASLAMMLVGAL